MLLDCTLREGIQAAGVHLPAAWRAALVEELHAAGVDLLEIGWVGQEGLDLVAQSCRSLGIAQKCAVWSPCRPEAVRDAARLKIGAVHIGMPVSSHHRQWRLGMSWPEAQERLRQTIQEAIHWGLAVRVGLEDASGASTSELDAAVTTAQEAGACAVRLADTRGIWNPNQAAATVRAVCHMTDLPVGVHCHNDFGMATANAISALEAGATWADGSLLGLGERSGISALEEMAAYLTVVRPCRTDNLKLLRQLCHKLSHALGIPLPPHKAVAGEAIFSAESGLHVDGLLKDPTLFEPYPPEAVGHQRRLLWGKKSGRAAVARFAAAHGIALSHEGIQLLLDHLRASPKPLEAAEVLHLARHLAHTNAPLPPTKDETLTAAAGVLPGPGQ
jgi:homocitrate synthase NifV